MSIAIAALFLVFFEMFYYMILSENTKQATTIVVFGIVRDAVFVVAGAEVFMWHRNALLDIRNVSDNLFKLLCKYIQMQLSSFQAIIQCKIMSKVKKNYERLKELDSKNSMLKHITIVNDAFFYTNYKGFLNEFLRTGETTFKRDMQALGNYSNCIKAEINRIEKLNRIYI